MQLERASGLLTRRLSPAVVGRQAGHLHCLVLADSRNSDCRDSQIRETCASSEPAAETGVPTYQMRLVGQTEVADPSQLMAKYCVIWARAVWRDPLH